MPSSGDPECYTGSLIGVWILFEDFSTLGLPSYSPASGSSPPSPSLSSPLLFLFVCVCVCTHAEGFLWWGKWKSYQRFSHRDHYHHCNKVGQTRDPWKARDSPNPAPRLLYPLPGKAGGKGKTSD